MNTPDRQPGKLSPDVLAAFFGAGAEPQDRPAPYTLTPEAEDLLEAQAEAEAEAADEWDCQDSQAYQAWLEAHPEAEPEAGP